MDRFCLYIHKKKIDDTPFYVGIGVKGRPYRKDGRGDYWVKFTKKHEYHVVVLEENLSWLDACDKEIKLINQIGRVKLGNGPLINLTSGGEGFNGKHTEETKKLIGEKGIGRIPWNKGLTNETDDRIKLMSEKSVGRIPWNKGCTGCQEYTEERNKKISLAVSGFKHTDETIEKIRFSGVGRSHKQVTKNKISDKLKKPVLQIKDGQVIKEWGSIQDAQNETGIMNISYVCLGKRNKAGGFGWEFKLV